METTAEKDLISLAQRGDEGAFEQLLSDAVPRLRSLLSTNYHLQAADIDDVIQESIIKVWKKIDTFRSESTFMTWFFIIVKNEALDLIKSRNYISSREVPAHNTYTNKTEDNDYEHITVEQTLEETASSIVERQELLEIYRNMIKKVLSELSPSHSQVIQLAIENDKSYKQIAEELGIPIGTVMSRLFFARKEAQKLIKEYAQRNAIQLTGVGRYE